MKRVAIIGGTGYGGAESLRWLLPHPAFEVTAVTSRRRAGERVDAVHGNLAGFTDLAFVDTTAEELAPSVDAMIFALPHATAMNHVPAALDANVELRVVDLSGDFRLDSAEAFGAAYGVEHVAPARLADFAYGLTEAARDRFDAVRAIANPGCFATAIGLGLWPLAAASALGDQRVFVAAATGSSGGGVEPKPGNHHPDRAHDFRAYKVLRHQHVSEIEAELGRASGGAGPTIEFVPLSAPMVRGIFATIRVTPTDAALDVEALYRDACEREPFLRYRPGTPRAAEVAGTNFCDLSVHVDGDAVVVLSAIDNLGKGMAGQAVQNLNRLFGFDETTGLMLPGTRP